MASVAGSCKALLDSRGLGSGGSELVGSHRSCRMAPEPAILRAFMISGGERQENRSIAGALLDRASRPPIVAVNKAMATWRDKLNELNQKWNEKWNEYKAMRLPVQLNKVHRVVTMPFSIFFLTYSAKIHPEYNMTQWRRARLALRFFWNNARMTSASSYRAHLVMAMKLMELPPTVKGCVVECGCYKGAMTVNLSIACEITGRKLKVYDSFEGLPPPTPRDYWPEGVPFIPGVFKGALDEVTGNVKKFGVVDVCEFHKGLFKDTLPAHEGEVVMAVVDVDYHSSLYDCVTGLWPHLVDQGYFFIDEYVFPDYCAMFYSEKFWRTRFGVDPPGLIGAGAGVGVGEYYLGPWREIWLTHDPGSIAYTRKGARGLWDYYPDEMAAKEPPGDASEKPA
jgi:O-methyltransferase